MQKIFEIKLCKICNSKGHTYDMIVYFGKQRVNAAKNVTPTHGIVLQLTREVEGFRHKLFVDNTM
jgi:hypothetical protein